ncbi:5'-nucleotidase SurE [Actinomycetospora sp. NBRC 106375]|uniref:5'/3'-nucleotidase SurE n=1 Tax=Actinomycetospora sp. NBRC 106375 TaxID=3032207 RepID=UPI0024A4A95F|nr:5'/3'-nucleotidase SurE [Actinomycetospora sp. NBRC 106375]GLZ50239.1 5'-nucleotidase SurE [Actinomycetospora sp. NBRC 106375]
MPGTNPRILLVNDDGIEAAGLALLEQQARRFTDDVWVVSPEREFSGGGHSISLTTPVRSRRLGPQRYAVTGTPTDCVVLAVWKLLADRRPDMVISGINHGENLADDMTYSGTIGAAMEAAILGIPTIAMSQLRELGQPPDFTASRDHGPAVLRSLLDAAIAPGIIVNVNFPQFPAADPQFIVTVQGRRPPGTFTPVAGRDGRNIPLDWIKITYDAGDPPAGTDLQAAAAGHVSVTALSVDLTSEAANEHLRGVFAERPASVRTEESA